MKDTNLMLNYSNQMDIFLVKVSLNWLTRTSLNLIIMFLVHLRSCFQFKSLECRRFLMQDCTVLCYAALQYGSENECCLSSLNI